VKKSKPSSRISWHISMANGEVSLTNNAKRVLCLVTFDYGSWVSLGSKPSCLGLQLDCWGFQGEIEDLRRSFKYMLLSTKLQLDYWTELGLVPFLVL
jgi:hypothetical protein